MKIVYDAKYKIYVRDGASGRLGFVFGGNWHCIKETSNGKFRASKSIRDESWFGPSDAAWFGPEFDTPEACALWLEMQS